MSLIDVSPSFDGIVEIVRDPRIDASIFTPPLQGSWQLADQLWIVVGLYPSQRSRPLLPWQDCKISYYQWSRTSCSPRPSSRQLAYNPAIQQYVRLLDRDPFLLLYNLYTAQPYILPTYIPPTHEQNPTVPVLHTYVKTYRGYMG